MTLRRFAYRTRTTLVLFWVSYALGYEIGFRRGRAKIDVMRKLALERQREGEGKEA
jgi:hypothetical protein